MKRLLLGLLMALSLACRPATTIEKVDSSVVRVMGEAGTCSGFVIQPNVVLTAAHCLEGGHLNFDGHDGKLILADQYFDLAVFSTDTGNKPALHLRDLPAVVDEPTLATGYPLGWTKPITTHNTVMLVNQKGPMDHSRGTIFQGEFVHGMSGGPVTDEYGEVVSIVQSSYAGLHYGVDTVTIHGFLHDAGVE